MPTRSKQSNESDLQIEFDVKLAVFLKDISEIVARCAWRVESCVIEQVIFKLVAVVDVIANYVAVFFDDQITARRFVFAALNGGAFQSESAFGQKPFYFVFVKILIVGIIEIQRIFLFDPFGDFLDFRQRRTVIKKNHSYACFLEIIPRYTVIKFALVVIKFAVFYSVVSEFLNTIQKVE